MITARLLTALLVCGTLSACGGGSSGSSTGGALSISPASASVAAGSTQLFTVTNGNGGIITWQVNGITGGNASVGTISSGGLYTAPAVPPVSQPVSINAAQGGMSGSVAVIVTYSNKSLNGQFVFTFDEIVGVGGAETNAVGIITADGNGNISGTEDVRSPTNYYPSQSVSGNYTLSANGQGTLMINGGSAGTLTLTLTLVGGAAQGVLTDATIGNVGGGGLYPVTATVSSVNVNGNYTITLGSFAIASNDNSVGVLDLTAPSINSGYIDRNAGGNYLQYNLVSGGYTIGSGNRGTLNLSVDGGNTFSNYVFYAVSPDQLELMCTDSGCVNTGQMYVQTSQSLSAGSYVFQLTGSSTGQNPDALLITGTINPTTPTGGSATLTVYENYNGNYLTSTGSTTFTVPSLGRGTITIPTPNGPRDFVFYVQSSGYLDLLETTSGFGNTTGFASATQGNATVASGQYLLATLGQAPSSTTVSTAQATLSVASSGQVLGQWIRDVNGSISTTTVSGTLAASQTPGTYALTLNYSGGQTASYVMAPVAPGVLLPIGTDSNTVRTGGMYIQYTTQ